MLARYCWHRLTHPTAGGFCERTPHRFVMGSPSARQAGILTSSSQPQLSEMVNAAGAKQQIAPPDILEKPLENSLFKGAQFWLSKLRLPKLLLEALAIIIFLLSV